MNQEELQVGKICYYGEWPPEALMAVREVLDPLAWMVPGWATHAYIQWCTDGTPGVSISCGIAYDYRRVNLSFFPTFLLSPPEDRRYAVMHDLLHGFSAVLADYARDTIVTLLPENESPKFREHALRELAMRHEQWTQDLAYCLSKNSNGSPSQ